MARFTVGDFPTVDIYAKRINGQYCIFVPPGEALCGDVVGKDVPAGVLDSSRGVCVKCARIFREYGDDGEVDQ
ncbi:MULTISPECIES: hypothetical protein [Streptomyces]|uniref:hypothetical protein n=1 Tax=Streptomyces TaxID=1883 RepID=UPI000B9E73BD|nr:hypothetical protein [Streptomyces kasugaensis]